MICKSVPIGDAYLLFIFFRACSLAVFYLSFIRESCDLWLRLSYRAYRESKVVWDTPPVSPLVKAAVLSLPLCINRSPAQAHWEVRADIHYEPHEDWRVALSTACDLHALWFRRTDMLHVLITVISKGYTNNRAVISKETSIRYFYYPWMKGCPGILTTVARRFP